MDTESKPFLIACPPHCGTRYMADVLKNMGLNVAHESLRIGNEIGTVSGIAIGRFFLFGKILTQTRHPYGFLGTIIKKRYFYAERRWFPPGARFYINVDDDIPITETTKPLKILAMWYRYYEYIEREGVSLYRYKIEDIYQDSLVLDKVIEILELKPLTKKVIEWSAKHGTRNPIPPSKRGDYKENIGEIKRNIQEKFPEKKEWLELTDKITEMANRYGYKL